MWLKFSFFLAFLAVSGQKVDYEIEEINLVCKYEHTKATGFACVVPKIESLTRDTRIEKVNKPPHSSKTSLSDVVTFHTYNTKLRYIPKRLGFHFPSLHTLSITKTDLRLLEFRDFRHMRKLRKLLLPENKIERVAPCVFRYVDSIEIINLDGNLITELDVDTFDNLPALVELSADRNKIESLDSGLFKSNAMLKSISMRWNSVTKVDVNFLRIDKIEEVDLRNNTCIHMYYEKGKVQLREFQNQTSGRCRGPEVC